MAHGVRDRDKKREGDEEVSYWNAYDTTFMAGNKLIWNEIKFTVDCHWKHFENVSTLSRTTTSLWKSNSMEHTYIRPYDDDDIFCPVERQTQIRTYTLFVCHNLLK